MSDKLDLQEQKYLTSIVEKISICKAYKPKFGQGKAVSLEEFEILYGSDPFYAWFGLDNSLMYAAHKAAGGITSLYRQIGTGCEQLFRQIIRDQLQLTATQAMWSYTVNATGKKTRKLSLDGRIQLEDLQSDEHKQKFSEWMSRATSAMGMDIAIARVLKGAVFEVRQGYKSKDSKRQNADIGNAGTAYTQGYLPVVALLSTQIDSDVADRYVNAGWLLLRGHLSNSSITSTYAFCDQVLCYDLAGFFQRNSPNLQQTVEQVLLALLAPSDPPEMPDELVATDEIELTDELEAAEEVEFNAQGEDEY
jgi:hypothetical protein